jgi:hypothetical protein
MKKQILPIAFVLAILITGTVSHAAVKNNIKELTPQEKVIKDFTAQFTLAPTVSSAGKGFIASSEVEGHQVSSAYNKRGNRVYTITRYPADNLAKNIIDIVKGSYDKYYITSMEKVEQPGFNAVYMVHLTNSNSIKTVRVSDNGLELLQDYKKS